MLKFLIVVLVIAIYIAIGELYLLFTDHKTARGYVLSKLECWSELKNAILNEHGKKGMHVYVAVCTVLVAILAPIEAIYCFIMGIITALFREN
jgi:hypothetical protein